MKEPPFRDIYTPFFRRFGSEKDRETKETEQLYERVRQRHALSSYSADNAVYDRAAAIVNEYIGTLDKPILVALFSVAHDLFTMEGHVFDMPDYHPNLSLAEMAKFRDTLRRKEHFLENESRFSPLLVGCVEQIVRYMVSILPAHFEPSPFTIPLASSSREVKEFIGDLYATFFQDQYKDAGLFIQISTALYTNLCAVSGIADMWSPPTRPFIRPTDNPSPVEKAVELYLKDTPFLDFFQVPVPLNFSIPQRFNHIHIIGGSGAGKTQLLQNIINHDLESDFTPSLIIVDSQADLIGKISRLEICREKFEDRLIIINPRDVDHPPALNIFDINRERLEGYDRSTKEQVVAGIIDTFDYLFGMIGANLTAKQSVIWRYVARLLLAIPETYGRNATLLDVVKLMQSAEPYEEAIKRLPEIQRTFFEYDFKQKGFDQTKEQIRYRLSAILENPTMARLFTCPENRIDIFSEMNKGSIILVDTAKDFLKSASSYFGRFFISIVLQAVQERSAIPEEQRYPAFLMVDEAAEYFDANIGDLLTTARKYRLGCLFAHQYLEQCTPGLRSALSANTAIKIANTRNTADAKALAADLRTTPEFILNQPALNFACYIEGVTPNAVSIKAPYGEMENRPRLSDGIYESFIAENRKKVSGPPRLPPPAAPPPQRTEADGPMPKGPTPSKPAEPWSPDFEPAEPGPSGQTVSEPPPATSAPDIDDMRALIRIAERAKEMLRQAGVENEPLAQIAPEVRQLTGPNKKRRKRPKRKFKPIVD